MPRDVLLQLGVAVRIRSGAIEWMGPTEEADRSSVDEVVDGGGATLVPGLVDAHSHLTGPGGSHWIERCSDPPETLRQVGRENAQRLVQAGILWARDVGAPSVGGYPVNLELRDHLRSQHGSISERTSSKSCSTHRRATLPRHFPLTKSATRPLAGGSGRCTSAARASAEGHGGRGYL